MKKIKYELLASAASLEKSKQQVGEYFYDPTFKTLRFKTENDITTLSNSKGNLNNFRIIHKKNRYRFEYITVLKGVK